MTFLSKPKNAKQLALTGRKSWELIGSSSQAENVCLRYVIISPSNPIIGKRKPHFHPNCEECIYVLSGEGLTHAGEKKYKIKTGESILISRGEQHYTENIGNQDLILLCFFPSKNVELIESET